MISVLKSFKLLLFCSFFITILGCKNISKSNSIEKESVVTNISVPASDKSLTPYLHTTDNNLYLSWQETTNDSIFSLNYSSFENGTFNSVETITTGTDWFVNWADYPAFVKNDNSFLAHHLQKSAKGTYTYDVMLSTKDAKDTAWSKPFKLHSDNTKSEHGFVSILPLENKYFVSWLDGRNTIKEVPADKRAMTLRGAFISNDGTITNDVELDSRVCDCCQTTATATQNGPIVFYRDRSNSKNETRDIYYVRYYNKTWTTPKKLFADNWLINGCPVNGPNSDALESTVVVAWFTAANDKAQVKLSFSNNNGETFQPPINVGLGNPIGRVNITLINEKKAIVSWMENEQVLIRSVSKNGNLGDVITVATSSKSRATGFPQLAYFDNEIYVATTEVDNVKSTKIKVSKVQLPN